MICNLDACCTRDVNISEESIALRVRGCNGSMIGISICTKARRILANSSDLSVVSARWIVAR